jgi:hypothetical protein
MIIPSPYLSIARWIAAIHPDILTFEHERDGARRRTVATNVDTHVTVFVT